MKHELAKDIPFFNNESFFKDGEHVYIHLSTEFPDFVGVLHRHQFVEVVYILSGELMLTNIRPQTVCF